MSQKKAISISPSSFILHPSESRSTPAGPVDQSAPVKHPSSTPARPALSLSGLFSAGTACNAHAATREAASYVPLTSEGQPIGRGAGAVGPFSRMVIISKFRHPSRARRAAQGPAWGLLPTPHRPLRRNEAIDGPGRGGRTEVRIARSATRGPEARRYSVFWPSLFLTHTAGSGPAGRTTSRSDDGWCREGPSVPRAASHLNHVLLALPTVSGGLLSFPAEAGPVGRPVGVHRPWRRGGPAAEGPGGWSSLPRW
jgi:hypothetical protein